MPKKILIVEDEANIRELLRLYLEREGYTVLEAENGVEGIKKWKSDKPDMLLLDVMMPVMDGWAVCREIRAESDVPIIMLTAKGETADRVSGLEMGADDYIVKPLEMPEVIARVRAVFRRMAPDDAPEKLSFDNLVIDKQAYDLHSNRLQANGGALSGLLDLFQPSGRRLPGGICRIGGNRQQRRQHQHQKNNGNLFYQSHLKDLPIMLKHSAPIPGARSSPHAPHAPWAPTSRRRTAPSALSTHSFESARAAA